MFRHNFRDKLSKYNEKVYKSLLNRLQMSF